MIVVEEVHKRYGPVHALKGVSFRATRGGITAILGPNGAGKTTLVEILEGYRSPDSGRVEVLGYDPRQGGREYRERIGIMLQASGFYEELNVLETLRLFCGYYPRPRRPEELVEVVGLESRVAAQVGRLSGGERRRLDLALALVGNPEMLFLDEPTTGSSSLYSWARRFRRPAARAIRRAKSVGKMSRSAIFGKDSWKSRGARPATSTATW